MKKLPFLWLLGLLISVFACSKSDDGNSDNDSTIDKSANLLATGDSAYDILSNESYDKLLIEIGYVSGYQPTETAIANFTDFLKQHTFKEDIEVIYKELESPNEESLSLQEIFDLEKENRTAYNTGSTLAIYIYFTDSPAEDDDEDEGLVTLGAVYQNTSMVIHEATVRKLAGQSFQIDVSDVEAATLNHEFGHLFGLVNLGTDMVEDHESQSENSDGEMVGDNHCNVDGCLMRAELTFSLSAKTFGMVEKNTYTKGFTPGCVLSGNSVLNLLQSKTARGVEIPGLGVSCVHDIQANGAK